MYYARAEKKNLPDFFRTLSMQKLGKPVDWYDRIVTFIKQSWGVGGWGEVGCTLCAQ